MTNHDEIKREIRRLDRRNTDEFKNVKTWIEKIEEKVDDVHDWMKDQQGFFRGQQSEKKPKDISGYKEMGKTIAILSAVIGALALIIQRTAGG